MNRLLLIFILLWCLIITGCTTIYVPISLTHPAEINLSQYETISFDRITGNMAADFKHYLKDELIKSSHLRIGNKPRQYRNFQEQILLESYRDAKREASQGKMTIASVLIFGNAESYYDEEVTFKKETCKRKDEGKLKDKKEDKENGKHKHEHDHKDKDRDGKYECTHYKRMGILTTFGHMDFTEAKTGQLLLSKNFKCKKDDYNTAIDESPASINKKYMYDKCLNQNVHKIFKAMSPWQEEVQIPFEKDYDLPNLEAGIYRAREGNFLGAIEIFSRELKAAEINPKIPTDSVVIAYWNLGLAYEYSWQFEKADRMFRRAYEITGNSKYIKEIAHAERLKEEREELLRQIP